jgi:hypothetical protein
MVYLITRKGDICGMISAERFHEFVARIPSTVSLSFCGRLQQLNQYSEAEYLASRELGWTDAQCNLWRVPILDWELED